MLCRYTRGAWAAALGEGGEGEGEKDKSRLRATFFDFLKYVENRTAVFFDFRGFRRCGGDQGGPEGHCPSTPLEPPDSRVSLRGEGRPGNVTPAAPDQLVPCPSCQGQAGRAKFFPLRETGKIFTLPAPLRAVLDIRSRALAFRRLRTAGKEKEKSRLRTTFFDFLKLVENRVRFSLFVEKAANTHGQTLLTILQHLRQRGAADPSVNETQLTSVLTRYS